MHETSITETENRCRMIGKLAGLFEWAMADVGIALYSTEGVEHLKSVSAETWASAGRKAAGRDDYVPGDKTRAGLIAFVEGVCFSMAMRSVAEAHTDKVPRKPSFDDLRAVTP